MNVSVVVPVYHAEGTLDRLVHRIKGSLSSAAVEFELILVNDGSSDQSWAMIQRLSAENRWVRGINLMRNFGQHNALLCGLRAARYDVLVTMDDDLQHPPEEIPRLIEELRRGADVVYGKPEREQHGLWRNLASRATKLAMERMIGVTRAREISSFRAFHTQLRDGFASFQSPFVSIDVLLTWSTKNFAAVEVRRERREVGKSNYTAWKLIAGTINVITAFSTLPLRMATMLGFFMAFFGTCVMAFVVVNYLWHGSMPGFPFLASIIAIFSGAQLVALGIMGEYLGRIFVRSMGRPSYIIRETSDPVSGPGRETISINEQSKP